MRACNGQQIFEFPQKPGELAERLAAPDWPEKAARCKRRFFYRCAVCFSLGPLDAHHRTYVRLWDEKDEDLTCLCRECHKLFHRNSKLVAWEPYRRVA